MLIKDLNIVPLIELKAPLYKLPSSLVPTLINIPISTFDGKEVYSVKTVIPLFNYDTLYYLSLSLKVLKLSTNTGVFGDTYVFLVNSLSKSYFHWKS